jgi:hypothetical protein
MGLVGLLHVLWRRRIAVAIGILLAAGVAVLGIQRGSGAASASSLNQVLIDTPSSLVADARARGAMTIYTRARLIGNLIATDGARSAIADRAGIDAAELAVAAPGSGAPPEAITPLAEQAIEVARPRAPYLVSVEVAPELPILTIAAAAPTREQAEKLGAATIAALPGVARAAPGGGSAVAIEPLGQPEVTLKPAPKGRAKVVIEAMMLLLFWCIGCVVLDGAARRRRGRAAWRRGAEGGARA